MNACGCHLQFQLAHSAKSFHQALSLTLDLFHRAVISELASTVFHHSPRYFPDPHVFKPERWLKSPLGKAPQVQAAFNPFSVGSRQCIGKGLAMMEMMGILATVLLKFDFKITDGEVGKIGEGKVGAERGRESVSEFQLYDHVIATKEGPFVQLRAR
jgi:hypothetical protein